MLFRNEPKLFISFSDTASATCSDAASATSSSLVRIFVNGLEVLSAEVYWALDVIEKHGSFNSCAGKSELFCLMCPCLLCSGFLM